MPRTKAPGLWLPWPQGSPWFCPRETLKIKCSRITPAAWYISGLISTRRKACMGTGALASGRWKASLLTSPSLSCGLFLVSTGFYSLFQTLLWRLRSCCGWVWLEPSLAGTVNVPSNQALWIFFRNPRASLCALLTFYTKANGPFPLVGPGEGCARHAGGPSG